MTTLARRDTVLEKDGLRITRQPDGCLLVIASCGHFTLDAADVAALNELMALPGPKPPLFSVEEQRRHAVEHQRKLDRERDAKAAAQAAEETRLREQYPELAETLKRTRRE